MRIRRVPFLFFFYLRASDKLTSMFFFLPADIQRRWRIGASIILAVRSFRFINGFGEFGADKGDSTFRGPV